MRETRDYARRRERERDDRRTKEEGGRERRELCSLAAVLEEIPLDAFYSPISTDAFLLSGLYVSHYDIWLKRVMTLPFHSLDPSISSFQFNPEAILPLSFPSCGSSQLSFVFLTSPSNETPRENRGLQPRWTRRVMLGA